jgi:hypothetical protein
MFRGQCSGELKAGTINGRFLSGSIKKAENPLKYCSFSFKEYHFDSFGRTGSCPI